MDEKTLVEAIQGIETIAREKYDGHYTIMSFTTGYKVVFGTPSVDYPEEYQAIYRMPIYENLIDAITNAAPL